MDEHNNSEDQEKKFLREIINANLKEKRSRRRWKIFFRLAVLGIVIFLIFSTQVTQEVPLGLSKSTEHTALIRLEGVIFSGAPAEASSINKTLQQAFENDNSKGVILYINSPGGSPVQSAQINRKIRHLRNEYPDKPIYAVVNDICASGAYYVAVATDAIYTDRSSLIGSIGVIYDGFGFTGLIEKLGIERRAITAGEHKNMLDPFLPEKQSDKQHVQALLDQIHQNFITAVTEGRKNKLKDESDIFSGLIWTGEEAVRLGLADAFGDSQHVADEIISAKEIIEYKPQTSFIDRLTQRISTHIKHIILEQVLFGALH